MAIVGNVGDSSKGSEISLDLANFAVDEYKKKENAVLEFVRVVKAKEQVVAGAVHHLTLEVIEAGKKIFYEAKVWVNPWMDFKELQEFKHSDQESSSGHAPGLKVVPADDPAVKDAADHAVIEDAVKFHMLLKVKWGSQEEKYKVEVHKDVEGRLLP
ncbi:hypothetical protein MKW92_026789 [Papaver armeniacum]|nr:hypothetical protein MKW92_026789 [Papaver armeniacum]